MAARPTIRALTNAARTASRRQLHITDPANIHETRTTSDISEAPRRPKTTAIASESSENTASDRKFSTTTKLSGWGDSSTIDFAYLPDVLDPDASNDGPIRVPLLLNTMYNGLQARAMYEDEPEATLKPLINLISADSTHISSPSPMSEVHDNNAVYFEGMSLRMTDPSPAVAEEDGDIQGAVKQFLTGVVDDILGPKKST